ncbi:head maturation protease, ClpP-related [Cetobacterium sp. ZOR0034]|uniref:head maturation protease, ClpP-related n=1 Tax=Cetobacterium sp. ZOR0034 TaxID=1339239 RepID=UPI0006464728|nr:head maturation protease, ClpP-related [Cetobacterium sp. ZOR0034]
MPVLNLDKGKLEVKNKAENVAELIIFGEIASSRWSNSDVIPSDVNNLLSEIGEGDALDIYINSPGGSVFAGIAIYNMLARHKGHKRVFVEGYAASIASVIAMAGDEIIVPENAYLMIHKAWGLAIGNADDLREQADLYERFDTTIANAYMTKAKDGKTFDEFLELMKAETWFDGFTAQDYFNVTSTEAVDIAAFLDGELCKNYKIPQNLLMNNIKAKDEKETDIQKDFGSFEIELAKAKLNLLINL